MCCFCASVSYTVPGLRICISGIILKPRKIRKNFPENLSDGISGNFGKFFPGIPGNSGNPRELFRKFGGVFTEHALWHRVHVGKTRRNFKKIRENFPENPTDGISGNLGKLFPGIPGNSGNPRELFRKFGGFPRTRAAEQGTRP
jgi:hypothetical protein